MVFLETVSSPHGVSLFRMRKFFKVSMYFEVFEVSAWIFVAISLSLVAPSATASSIPL